MLHQIHWQYRGNRPTEFIRQFDVPDDMDSTGKQQVLDRILKEVNESHPLPQGALWLLCNDKSKHFMMCPVEDNKYSECSPNTGS